MLGARRVHLLGQIVIVTLLAVGLPSAWSLTDHVPTTATPPAPAGTFVALFQHNDNQVFPPYPAYFGDIIARTASLSTVLQALPLAARLNRLRAFLTQRDRMEPQYGMMFSLEFNSDVLPAPIGVTALRPRVVQLIRRRVWFSRSAAGSTDPQLVQDWTDWESTNSVMDWLRHAGIMHDDGWVVDGGDWPSMFPSKPYYNWVRTANAGLLQGFSDRQCIMWDTPGFIWSSIKNIRENEWLKAEFQVQSFVVADGLGAIAGMSAHIPLGYVDWGFTSQIYRGASMGETAHVFSGVRHQWVDGPSSEYSYLINTNYRAWLLTPMN